ncbi:MAG: hypothetical protein VYD19_01160 [Myxococcota bacterium]|nr:hypothetical protein [Myxococcota bacterium]
MLAPITELQATPRRGVERLLSARERSELTRQQERAQVELTRHAEPKQGYQILRVAERGAGVMLRPCLILTSSHWLEVRIHEAKVRVRLSSTTGWLEEQSRSSELGLIALRQRSCHHRGAALPLSDTRRVQPAETLYALRLDGDLVERVTFLGEAPLPFSFFDWAVARLSPGLPLFDQKGALVTVASHPAPHLPTHMLFIPPQALREFLSNLTKGATRPKRDDPSGRWWSRRLSDG